VKCKKNWPDRCQTGRQSTRLSIAAGDQPLGFIDGGWHRNQKRQLEAIRPCQFSSIYRSRVRIDQLGARRKSIVRLTRCASRLACQFATSMAIGMNAVVGQFRHVAVVSANQHSSEDSDADKFIIAFSETRSESANRGDALMKRYGDGVGNSDCPTRHRGNSWERKFGSAVSLSACRFISIAVQRRVRTNKKALGGKVPEGGKSTGDPRWRRHRGCGCRSAIQVRWPSLRHKTRPVPRQSPRCQY
jgi:hypothetical protein